MRVLARCKGMFGTVRIKERVRDGARLYCIGRSVQTMVRTDGVSMVGYVHAAKLMLKDAYRVLIIGGGGGSLATMLARRDHKVVVLEIDPVAEDLARRYFQLDPRVEWHTGDPFEYLNSTKRTFDAVVVDACDTRGLAPPFDKTMALHALRTRACPTGALIVNVAASSGNHDYGRLVASHFAARGDSVRLYSALEGIENNVLLHISAKGDAAPVFATRIRDRPAEVRTYLESLIAIPFLNSQRRARNAP